MLILSYILVGLVIGVISGALGIGGGVLLVPILIWFFGFPYPKAIGTTLGVLVPPVGLLAAISYYQKGFMDLHAAIWIALSFAVGAFLGAEIVPNIPANLLRALFGMLLIYVGVRFFFDSDQAVSGAAAGLIAVAFSWLFWLVLRGIGRNYSPRRLGLEISRYQQANAGEPDYYI